ncbi:hypothetical protein [Myxococcus landrumensis]|uniref:Uncharacterized protein n=1 Tax=Myxococcus landrumensis TaxID=2813577 RepID=A0ABX7NFA1_9BACT|nr:hypothetical protein [Myxococcus landrumus]QSQ16066.1 hypothetical protein JY572_08460 [Myxococcus landrumus]
MSTPRSVRYSPVSGSPVELWPAVGEILERLDISVQEVGRLEKEANGEVVFAGEAVACSSVDQVLDVAHPWGDFAIRTWAEAPNQAAYLYWWWQQESWQFGIELESSLVFYEKGEWLRIFLVSMMGVIRTQVCGLSPHLEPGLFKPLEPEMIVKSLRSGTLVDAFPHFHMLATDLVTVNEVKSAVERAGTPRLKYQCTTTGYHVLSEL